ncbi:hypothetical protein ABZ883_26320 [Streptomyces sp. NPDC046977]|uniref:hypothetical protein n=1 Tax=Streptomyces sp. NPDC046977 TaxID=3154703 RepID=UPI00340C829A
MIPAQHVPYEARYSQENNGRKHFTTKPVVAWDDNGTAQVVDEKTGHLRDANSYTNFADLVPVALAPVVAAIPGGGWRVEYRDDEDEGRTFSEPVLAWQIRADGDCVPLTVDATGYACDPCDGANFVRVFLPAEERHGSDGAAAPATA